MHKFNRPSVLTILVKNSHFDSKGIFCGPSEGPILKIRHRVGHVYKIWLPIGCLSSPAQHGIFAPYILKFHFWIPVCATFPFCRGFPGSPTRSYNPAALSPRRKAVYELCVGIITFICQQRPTPCTLYWEVLLRRVGRIKREMVLINHCGWRHQSISDNVQLTTWQRLGRIKHKTLVILSREHCGPPFCFFVGTLSAVIPACSLDCQRRRTNHPKKKKKKKKKKKNNNNSNKNNNNNNSNNNNNNKERKKRGRKSKAAAEEKERRDREKTRRALLLDTETAKILLLPACRHN